MAKYAIVVSGYLHGLSDNIVPFLDKDTDVFVHTWNDRDNGRWITKFNRYKGKVRNLIVKVENPVSNKALDSLLYSTYQAFNLIENPEQYETILKFKPDLDTDIIPYSRRVSKYYNEAKIQSRPLLNDVKYKECVFGRILYKTLDERMFTASPYAWRMMFDKEYGTFTRDCNGVKQVLQDKHGIDYEGSVFWYKYMKECGLTVIQDLTLKLTNCKYDQSYKQFTE